MDHPHCFVCGRPSTEWRRPGVAVGRSFGLCGECFQVLTEVFANMEANRHRPDRVDRGEPEPGLRTCPACRERYEVGDDERGVQTVTHRADQRRTVRINGVVVHACEPNSRD